MRAPVLLATLLAAAASTQAATITVTAASNTGADTVVSGPGTSAGTTYTVTSQVPDNSASPGTLGVTIANIDIDGFGGANDTAVLTFTVTTDGQPIQTHETNAGWFSSGPDTTAGGRLNADGEYVTLAPVAVNPVVVNLNGGSGNGSGSFAGFTGVDMGAWGNGDAAVVVHDGGLVSFSEATNATGEITFAASQSLQSIFDVSNGAAGTWRPENFDFQVTFGHTPVPEPSSAMLLGAFLGLGLLVRRR